MAIKEQCLVCTLEIRCFCNGGGTCEFVVKENGVRIEDHAQASFPETHAIVSFFVVGGFVCFIKSAHLFKFTWRQKEGARTVVHVAR